MSRMFLVSETLAHDGKPEMIPGDYPWAKIEELDPAGRWVTNEDLFDFIHESISLWVSKNSKVNYMQVSRDLEKLFAR